MVNKLKLSQNSKTQIVTTQKLKSSQDSKGASYSLTEQLCLHDAGLAGNSWTAADGRR
jgi:hypothetical protein